MIISEAFHGQLAHFSAVPVHSQRHFNPVRFDCIPLGSDEPSPGDVCVEPQAGRLSECGFLVLVHQELDNTRAVVRSPNPEVLWYIPGEPLHIPHALCDGLFCHLSGGHLLYHPSFHSTDIDNQLAVMILVWLPAARCS